MPVTKIKSSWKSGDLVFEKTVATANPQLEFGIDGTGLDVIFYGDTASVSMLWDESLDKLTMTSAAIESTLTTGTTGKNGVKVTNIFTLATTGVHKAIEATATYTPATTGYATTIGIAGKASIAAAKQLTGGVGYIWGIQGQLDFGTSAVLNNTSSIVAALRGVLTGTTPVMTDILGVSNLYLDNLIATDLTGMSSGESSFIYCANSGKDMDCAIRVYVPQVSYLFVIDAGTVHGGNPAGPMVTPSATTSGSSVKIKCDIDGTEYYLNAYTG